MCGIVGILGNKLNNRITIYKMLEVQKHRGPDAMTIWDDNCIVLGHNRLSIIDLSETANQPMISTCGRYTIVFNGEIYNYTELKEQLKAFYNFRTQSDTEVLLAAYIQWGIPALDKLNGMFSFAIWDNLDRKLVAVRDRFGVKPFYYAIYENQLYFGSEIKTLFAAGIPKVQHKKVWANYFVYGTYGMPTETFWENINQIPAGHFFEWRYTENQNQDRIKLKKWYDFPKRIKNTVPLSLAELKIEYEALLKDAVQLRFRADVPLGMNVSGGLDSSTLINLVHQHLPSQQPIEAFTFYSDNEKYDELPWVEALLQTTPYPLHKVLLDYKQIPQLIETISWFQDEPFGGFPTLAYSLLFAEAKKKGIKVILDGQGMDEAWAGYDYYHNQSDSLIQGLNSSPVRPEVLVERYSDWAQKEVYDRPFETDLQNLQYRDLFYTKIPRALRFNDRISMMHSTELREPFLDYRLVELAFAQSENMKIQNGQTKWLLRDLVKKQLGDTIALAPKRALQTPQREWIAKELAPYFIKSIALFSALEGIDEKQVQAIWKEYCDGNQDNSFYIWQWINAVELE
ncbi:asparagine synthase (glutamine-hydrolyzing) [Flavobacterium sp. CG_9.1]|uniref:asparagine synthase (glutamine-hydrolyzing) n=1 Tax=Flavobacterium sp. CG_9.1 TaxID=2787728 RepID=UPI0018C8DB50|nr:asparagine synthase (glutamine-hydrolyzing) [Flavobacterium sp. CG_9.1]MBG6062969.1 asparagine synthase (glutamine-hydrolyzing) [Flavobacterium sp. CG_9.1]